MDNNYMHNSSLGSRSEWIEYCQLVGDVASSEFKNFRRHPLMLMAIEGTGINSSLQNINFFRKNNRHTISSILKKISHSDCIGNPLRCYTFKHNDEMLSLNPTTLRYAKNWANILDCFLLDLGNHDLKISEIGAGYGGEAKVFYDILSEKKYDISNIQYDIYDLPSSKNMINRFLSEFEYSVNFKSIDNIEDHHTNKHLVISNGALSEMRGQLLNDYLDKIVLKADYGYFIVNFDTHSKPFEGGMSNKEFYEYLSINGKKPFWLDEEKFLTTFDKGSSKLIIFGSEQKLINKASQSRNLSFFNKLLYKIITAHSSQEFSFKSIKKKYIK